ncbi:YbdD/YjiX family protein [Dietzia cinnamea]|uniref:EcsC family protein n=1 Tax=Dietzia cinnamea TaxID=321318 RepID=A0A4R3ZVW2_9ACTN|nr:hypothetical protein [Dietzia cinnamea]KZO58774.1 hypothetical protein A2U19_10280 [Dietzia maris]MCT2057470.1 hypothetical protein [Dietzia cinnamea]MCT2098357.1 hypothetical protein [Dietzia cinnamea]MCT2120203.1 hypothetical protein [Dietzia cinnamea]MCT2146503.1 hypothetical protein [Dietzia cinnamea]
MPDRVPAEASGPAAGVVTAALRRAIRGQAGAARAYVRQLRRAHPDESPARIRERLDSRFLTAVTASGAAVGAAAAVPGIGTVVAIGAVGAESLVFLEAAAFYTMAVAEVHGIDVREGEHEELLVMTVMLGASGTAILANAVGPSGGAGSLASRSLHVPGLKEINRRMLSRFARKFAVKRAGLAVGKLAPAGLGAAVGGWGNRRLGRTVVETADATFGASPKEWPTV